MSLVPQIGFFEIVVIAVIALVVVGPKDLPKLMNMVGKLVAQARKLAGEFAAAFDQMARESEMEEMRKEIEALKNDNAFVEAKRTVEDAVRPVEQSVREESAGIRDTLNRPQMAEEENSPHPEEPDSPVLREASADDARSRPQDEEAGGREGEDYSTETGDPSRGLAE